MLRSPCAGVEPGSARPAFSGAAGVKKKNGRKHTARVWVDVLGGRNPYAVALLGQFLLMLYYFPAHNKNMQSGEGVLAFAVLLGAWLLMRRRPAW